MSTKENNKLIRKQMEFYFSDANLNRDTYMRQTISGNKDGCIPLSDFLNFNRIRKLTTDVDIIAKALKKSKILQFNDEGTAVCRSVPMKDIENVDDKTVYVEFLPLDATHDWMIDIFSSCGKVSYVSIPKYRRSGVIKQFAFVEFETVDAAATACKKLNNPPVTAANKAGKFPVWNKTLYSLTQRAKGDNTDESAMELTEESADDITTVENYSTDTTTQSESNEIAVEKKAKKRKKTSNEDNEEDVKEEKIKKSKKTKAKDSSTSVNGITKPENSDSKDLVAAVNESDAEKPKNKKRSDDLPQLRVIPKAEWIKLKAEYVSLQKTSMDKLRNSLNKSQIKAKPNLSKQQPATIDKVDALKFLANVIVKVESEEPITKQQITDEFASSCQIAYIDILPTQTITYIRCKDAKSAAEVTAADGKKWDLTLLQGDEEKQYWDKIQSDRQTRFSNSQKQKKKKKQKPPTQNKKIIFD